MAENNGDSLRLEAVAKGNWWKDLPTEKKESLFTERVLALREKQLKALTDKVDIKRGPKQSFVSLRRTVTRGTLLPEIGKYITPGGYLIKQITRAHLVPDSLSESLVVGSQADYFYDAQDQKKEEELVGKRGTKYPDSKFPSVVRVRRLGESASLAHQFDPWYRSFSEEASLQSADNSIVLGSESIEEEALELQPMSAYREEIGGYGSSILDVIRDGQHFRVNYAQGTGEMRGVLAEDYIGKNKYGRVVAGEGITLTKGNVLEVGLLTRILAGEEVAEGSFSALRDPETGLIIISRTIAGVKSPVMIVPNKLDEKKSIENLFDLDSIERPFEAPVDDDLFEHMSLPQALGIQIIPRNLGNDAKIK